MKKIGFIGMGIMGQPMAGHILKAGYEVTVYNRTTSKTQPLADAGAKVASTPQEVAQNSDIIITIVSRSKDVEEVLFGENGVASADLTGKIVIDMSTIEQSETIKFATKLKEKGATLLDAPVSGGDVGAKNATLTIMVGGDKATYEQCLPLFQTMGKSINHMGESGTGQATKMCNQIMVVSSLMGVCEGFALAKANGLDLNTVREVILGGVGASAQLNVLGPKIIAGDHSPGFFVELMEKDLGIVKDTQSAQGLPGDIVALGLKYMQEVMKDGGAQLGTQSIATKFGAK